MRQVHVVLWHHREPGWKDHSPTDVRTTSEVWGVWGSHVEAEAEVERMTGSDELENGWLEVWSAPVLTVSRPRLSREFVRRPPAPSPVCDPGPGTRGGVGDGD